MGSGADTKPEENIIKPCPFCGEVPDLEVSMCEFSIACNNKKCLVQPDCWLGANKSRAIKKWNKRI